MQNFDFQRINVNFPRNSYSLIIYLSLITLISVLCFYTPVWSPSKRIWNIISSLNKSDRRQAGPFVFWKKKRKKVRIEEKGARRLGSSFGDILETLYLAMLFYLHPSFIYSFWALKIDFLTVWRCCSCLCYSVMLKTVPCRNSVHSCL